MRTLTAALVVLLAATAHAEPQVKPLAITVGSAALDGMDFQMRPGNISTGVSVHVLVSGLDRSIVDIDGDASTLDKATDSTGKDLLKKPAPQGDGMTFTMGNDAGIGAFPSVSDDGKLAVLELLAPAAPAKGATSITFEGKLALITATGTKTETVAGLALAPGTFKLAGEDFEITEVAASDWEPGKFKLALRMSKAAHDRIASWKITGPDGAILGEGPYSTMTMMNTVDVEIALESKPANATLELEVYEGTQRVMVPVKLEVGLGLE